MFSQGNTTGASAPLVSVAITAFNSEKWLAKAIDSVLRQRTGFAVEIVVGDDCSADGTLAVARSYQRQHPQMIRVLERPRNIGMQRNFYETFEHCQGKYIAWLDADDTWTDPEKLETQVGVLESDPSVSVCCHFVRWVTVDGAVRRDRYPTLAPGRYGLAEIVRRDFVPSPSILFRNGIHRDLPAGFFELRMADWPVLVFAALGGDIVLLDRVMADYRLTPGSSMSSKGSLYWYEQDAHFYEFLQSVLPTEWRRVVRKEMGKRYESVAYLRRQAGDFSGSREAAIKAFRSPAWMDNCASKTRTLAAAVVREMRSKVRPVLRDQGRG